MGKNIVLQFKTAYTDGLRIADLLFEHMNGAPCTWPHDIGVLVQMVTHCSGVHLEIGSAFGGTAIAAALVNKDMVHCIDPFDKDYAPFTDLKTVSEELFWENVDKFKVRDKVKLNEPVGEYGSAFIDGDHSYHSVVKDWNMVKKITKEMIMFHDYGNLESVRNAIYDVVIPDKEWVISHISGQSLIMRKRDT